MPALTVPALLLPAHGSPLCVERFVSRTAFSEARSGREDRRRVRAYPYYGVSTQHTIWGAQESDPLAALKGEASHFWVPAWQHPLAGIQSGATTLDVFYRAEDFGGDGAGASTVRLFVRNATLADGTEVGDVQCEASVFAGGVVQCEYLHGAARAWPMYLARVDEDALELEQRTGGPNGVKQVSLSFVSQTLDEGDAYSGPVQDGLPIFPTSEAGYSFRHGGVPLRDKLDRRVEREEAGNLELSQRLFDKRSLTATYRMTTRRDVVAMRAFLRHLCGRYRAFLMQDPATGTGPLLRWRLADDTSELTYYRHDVAEARLSMVHIPEGEA